MGNSTKRSVTVSILIGGTVKLHKYTRTEVEASLQWFGNKYWRYDITACGLRRQSAAFHIDGVKTTEEVTCKKCKATVTIPIRIKGG